ncbi:hypothetical protein SDC9_210461 [bioreactor metagenome]|uniref:Uncharacterized protein n=1 Tax=bioreactor metagenome TaxID=1076179 RepID=A0A645JG77_9ZZZZ
MSFSFPPRKRLPSMRKDPPSMSIRLFPEAIKSTLPVPSVRAPVFSTKMLLSSASAFPAMPFAENAPSTRRMLVPSPSSRSPATSASPVVSSVRPPTKSTSPPTVVPLMKLNSPPFRMTSPFTAVPSRTALSPPPPKLRSSPIRTF